jgi:hypothetical protein
MGLAQKGKETHFPHVPTRIHGMHMSSLLYVCRLKTDRAEADLNSRVELGDVISKTYHPPPQDVWTLGSE